MAGSKKGAPSPPTVTDERFAKIHSDPRFGRMIKRKQKVKLDKRFHAVLKDKRFQVPKAPVDKYGRKQKKSKEDEELRRFYDLEEETDQVDDREASKKEEVDPRFVLDSKRDWEEEEEEEEEDSEDGAEDEEQLQIDRGERGSAESDEESADEEDDGKSSLEKRMEKLNRMARGETSGESDEDSDLSSDEEDEEGEEVQDEFSDLESIEIEGKESEAPLGEATRRIAVVSLDWENVKAVDLLVVFQSFAPPSCSVKNVTIYPSDFGLKRMEEEQVSGPSVLKNLAKSSSRAACAEAGGEGGDAEAAVDKNMTDKQTLKRSEQEQGHESADSEDSSDSDSDADDREKAAAEEENGSAATNELDEKAKEAIRRYEQQKLRYYFAVVTCDSVKCANHIYNECDRMEFELSANKLDLRFIPDDLSFEDREPHSTCSMVPPDYKAPQFSTKSLCQSNVELTWDEAEIERTERFGRFDAWTELADSEIHTYIASTSGESSDEEEGEDAKNTNAADEDASRGSKKSGNLADKYRSLLLGSLENEDSTFPSGGKDEDEEGDMEISFMPKLGEDILEKKKQREERENETPWEKYVRERKEKKKEKRKQRREELKSKTESEQNLGGLEDDDFFAVGDDDNDDKLAAQNEIRNAGSNGDGKDKDDSVEESAAQEEEEENMRDFDMNAIARHDRLKGKKLRGQRRRKEEKKAAHAALQDGFAMDVKDPRFAAVFSSDGSYAIDPTNAKFKRTAGMEALLKERSSSKRQREFSGQGDGKALKDDGREPVVDSAKDMKSLVASIKQKQLGKKVKRW